MIQLEEILQALKKGNIASAYPSLIALHLSRQGPADRFDRDAVGSAIKTYANAYLETLRNTHETPRAQHADVQPTIPNIPKLAVNSNVLYTGPDPTLTSRELDKLTSLHNRYKNQRIFVMGNGPSLNNMDLSLLQNDHVFCLNRISLLFKQVTWRPSFYTAFDLTVVPDNLDEFNAIKVPYKFFATKHKGAILEKDEHYWYHDNSRPGALADRFEPNSVISGFGGGGTVTTLAIQIAYYMGFDPIILVGCDASYMVPDSVIQSGPDKFHDGIKLYLTSTENDDLNHFDKSYFGKGKKWHNPNVAEMHRGFEQCYKIIQNKGRVLVNATVGGALECVPRVKYENLFLSPKIQNTRPKIGIDFTQPLANKATGMRNYFLRALKGIDLLKPNLQLYLFCTTENQHLFVSASPSCASICLSDDPGLDALVETLDCLHYPFNSVESQLKIRSRTKKIVSIHDLIPITQPGFPESIKQGYLRAAKEADAVICLSNPTRDLVCRTLPVRPSSCFVSPPVLEGEMAISEVEPTKDETTIMKEIAAVKGKWKLRFPYVLYPAAYRDHKNHDILIRAMRYVYTNLHLVLTTGESHDPAKGRSLTEKIAKLNLSHRVHVLGHLDRSDLITLYKGAVAVVFPSLDEGFGIPVMEAQGLGVPVIASRCGSLADVARGSLEIDPLCAEDIAEKINAIHSDEELKAECIREGRKNAARFTQEAGARGLLEAYYYCLCP